MEYDDKIHTYTEGGIRLPSVTEIVNQGKDLSWLDPKYAEYGTAIHKLVCDELKHKDNIKGFEIEKQQIHKLYNMNEFGKVIKMEQPIINKTLWYAGRYDIFADVYYIPEMNIKESLIEIKTGNYQRSHKMQLILYMLAMQDMGILGKNIPLYYCRISATKGFEWKEVRYTQKDIDAAIRLTKRYQF